MNIKKHPFIFTFNILIFFFAILFFYTDSLSLSINGIYPLLIIPILTAFSLFHSPIRCAVAGLLCGIFMDACMVGSYCFNAIILLCIGVFVAVSSNNFFNKNIQSATVLSLITSSVYFVLQWIFFHTYHVSVTDNLMYLFKYAFPSAVFTAVFIYPFYYLYKHFHKLQME